MRIRSPLEIRGYLKGQLGNDEHEPIRAAVSDFALPLSPEL